MKRTIIFLLAVLCIMICGAQKTVVWKAPQAVNTPDREHMFQVTEVELSESETVMHLHVIFIPRYWIKFVSSSILKTADGKEYAITGGKQTRPGESSFEPDSLFWMPESGEADLALHFAPLPLDTRSFDFIEGYEKGAFRIYNITEGGQCVADYDFFDSSWRNDETGDWEIGFYEKFAVYGCDFWEYKSRKERKDRYEMVLTNGKDELHVVADKDKAGKRRIAIGGKKKVYSLISSRYLPDYPMSDETALKDNGFVRKDSVTLIGWFKDWPEEIFGENRKFEVTEYRLLTRDERNACAGIDSLGRFRMKFPIENSADVYMDWRRARVASLLEPGETYLLMMDLKAGRKLFMGKNARMQNELQAHRIDPEYVNRLEREKKLSEEEALAFKDEWAEVYRRNLDKLDTLLTAHPTLSRRFRDYHKVWFKYSMLSDLLQAMFYTENNLLPAEVMNYADGMVDLDADKPYTQCQSLGWYLYYRLLQAVRTSPLMSAPFSTIEEMVRAEKAVADSLFADEELRDICLCRTLMERLEHERVALSSGLLDMAGQISLPAARGEVLALNARYVALQQEELVGAASLRLSSDVEGLTDGEEILRKIIEPYKGRLVYLDVWGTWCSPCKQALKESHKLKEALKDHDIVYLYLANRSQEDSWKNVIKEYHLTGEDCVHYNLPAEQQEAVQRYLNIRSYPSYRLIGKDGQIHPLDWRHADNMDAFRRMVEAIDK